VGVIDYVMEIFLFFFSSRRRHTRCLSDWSSDVCSSDLIPKSVIKEAFDDNPEARQFVKDSIRKVRNLCVELGIVTPVSKQLWKRSEERRVGKECRSMREPE